MSFRRLLPWLRRSTDAELREELEYHRARLQDDLEAAGATHETAVGASRRMMGNMTLAREDALDVWVVRWLDTLWRDLRYGARALRREPTFAASAVLTLTLGVAMTTTVFSVVDAELWKALPYPHPEQLVAVDWQGPGSNSPYEPIAGADLDDWRAEATSFADLAGAGRTTRRVLRLDTSESIYVTPITSNYFSLLGRRIIVGRTLDRSDEPGGRGGLLSERAWRRLFDGKPAAVGRTVTIDGEPVSIVGVLGPDESLGYSDLYVTIDSGAPEYRDRTARPIMTVIGRLRPGADAASAEAELQTLAGRLARAYPTGRTDHTVHVSDLRRSYTGYYWRPLYFFLAASFVVLFLSCVNVANLLLARALRRKREFAIRGALGGGRRALARQLLTEGAMLAVPSGVLALLATKCGLALLATRIPPDYLERGTRIPVDLRVAAFALIVTGVTAAIFGLAPVRLGGSSDVRSALGEGGRTAGHTPTHVRAQRYLLVGQIAATVVLLAAAGIFLHSYVLLTQAPLGFDPADRATIRVSLSGPHYSTDEDLRRYAAQLLDVGRSTPGVRQAAVESTAPLESGPLIWFVLPERPRPARGNEPHALLRVAGPGFFRTMGIRIVRGREFSSADANGAPRVAIVNQVFARRMFEGTDPTGKSVELVPNPRSPAWMNRPGRVTIVGVAEDVKQVGIGGIGIAEICLPFAQAPAPWVGLVVHTAGGSASLADLRARAAAIDPDVPVTQVATFDQRVADALRSDRFNLLLIATFAFTALVISGVGIYAVVAYAVQDRTREFGVRLALGARPAGVIGLALWQAIRVGTMGAALGLASTFVVARAIGSALYVVPGQHDGLIYGVRTTDPAALAWAVAGVLVVSLAAGLVPARRVARIDPVVALRGD